MDNKNTRHVVRDLSNKFNIITRPLGSFGIRKARMEHEAPNEVLYKLQTEMAYILNDIHKCPEYMLSKMANQCENFIQTVVQSVVQNNSRA